MQAYLIESGEGWTHVDCIATNIPTTSYMLVDMQDLLLAGRLPSFAFTPDEQSFFVDSNVTSLSFPTFGINISDGYDSGNALLGLSLRICEVISI